MIPILELNKVTVENNNSTLQRLRNIDLSIYAGEKIAILGSSGAGKTTLISVANGSLTPKIGKVKFKGLEIKSLTPRQRTGIATLWQDLRLIEELSVCQTINCGALGRHNLMWAIANLIGSIEADINIRYLQAVDLPSEILNEPIINLSGGQRQRVAIARVIRQHAELLLADEPLSNLEPKLINEILQLLIKDKSSEDFSIPNTSLISLHRPDLINSFTRIIGIKEGNLVLDKSPKHIDSSDIELLYSKE